MLAVLVVIIYLIIAMTFFVSALKGRFYDCHFNGHLKSEIDTDDVLTMYDCINNGGHWVNSDLNFDSISNSMIACLAMITKEGWVGFMFQAANTNGIGLLPKENSSVVFYPVFIVYMIFISIFMGNLFIEVIIATYEK